MDFQSSSSSTLQSVKDRIREKLNGSLKAVKLQTSLAAKIKTKTLNNSSILKVSLKHNNRALACALTAEREKSRGLGNDKMLLQKEVNMLQFQLALLRQNLSIVNKMLNEIDVCMNSNLPKAIKIISTMESSDLLSLSERKSERFSQQSALSLDEEQGYSIIGVPLRIPINSMGQQKLNNPQPILVNEEKNLPIVPLSPRTNVVRENHDKLDEVEMHSGYLSPKERHSLCNKNRRDSFSNSVLPLDEVFSPSNRNAQSGGFVTRRRKRSTVFRSSIVPRNSETIQTRSSMGSSSPSTHWEMNADVTVLPESGYTGLGGTEKSYTDSVLQKGRLSTTLHCSSQFQSSDTDPNSDAGKDFSKEAIPSTIQLKRKLNEEGNPHTDDGYVGQEKTVYEADMEMTSSEPASIIAVLPKNKTQAFGKMSFIPVKQTGTLRKVRKMARERTKRTESSLDQQVNFSNSSVTADTADDVTEKLTSDKPYDRRTYVLPGSVVQEELDVLESGKPPNLEVSASRESCVAGQIFPDDTIVLNGVKGELTLRLQKDPCTEVGNVTDVAPKRRSKNVKEASRMERSRKKKHKMQKNAKDEVSLTEQQDNLNESSDQVDSSKKINTMPSIHANNKEPKIRRETYVVSAVKQTPMTHDLISKAQGVNYRRETVVISEPNPLVSVILKTSALEVRKDSLEGAQNNVNPHIPIAVSHKTESRSASEKEHSNAISNLDEASDYKKPGSKYSEKKTLVLFSEVDKRKTYIVPSKQEDLRCEKATLVRESFVNPTSREKAEAIKCPDNMGNKNESFMLDMVSESILDNTTASSSFAELSLVTNRADTFAIGMSLKSIPAPELPVAKDYNKECSLVSNNINVLDENDGCREQGAFEIEIGSDRQCKVGDSSMEIHEAAITPFQDLTNKSLDSTKQSPKSDSEKSSHRPSRRNRILVSYKEPSIKEKMRRENRGMQHLRESQRKKRNKKGGEITAKSEEC